MLPVRQSVHTEQGTIDYFFDWYDLETEVDLGLFDLEQVIGSRD